ncbi:hypothetical protein WDW37_06560 [Bdellovibrionota bacterium FG-1]
MRWYRIIAPIITVLAFLTTPKISLSADFVVYSVYKGLDLGIPGETPQKDYYVNMGSSQGIHMGSHLDVLRRLPTYDVLNEKLYKDVTFAIAKLKVIHVENNAAICRLEKTLPPDKTPVTSPHGVMVGDLVRTAE